MKIERMHLSNCVLFYDTPCIASFLVRSFTIYFKVKCIIRDKTGHLSKSPTINIPAFGYFESTRSYFENKWSIHALLSHDGG